MIRRNFLSLLIAVLGLPALLYTLRTAQRTTGTSQFDAFNEPPNPRFRKRKQPHIVPTTLAEGSYVNPKSNVVHRVGPKGRLRAVFGIKADRLTPMSLDAIPPQRAIPGFLHNTIRARDPHPRLRNTPNKKHPAQPRPRFASSSALFESAALHLAEAGNPEAACKVLVAGIGWNVVSAAKTKGTISVRLYDLLAAIAARHAKENYLDQAAELLRDRFRGRPLPPSVTLRLNNWKNSSSKWHARWHNTSKKWVGLPM